MMRMAMLTAGLALGMLGGCGSVQTLGPEEFLYAYRAGALKGELSAGGTATYAGHDDRYQYITLHSASPSDQFIYGSAGRKLRCLADDLPDAFPRNFVRPTGEQALESTRDAEEYVEDYLKRYKPRKETVPRAAQAPDSLGG